MHDCLDAIKIFVSNDNYYSDSSKPLTRESDSIENTKKSEIESEVTPISRSQFEESTDSAILDEENRFLDNYLTGEESVDEPPKKHNAEEM